MFNKWKMKIEIDICNEDDINWINKIKDKDDYQEILQTVFSIGHLALKCSQTKVNFDDYFNDKFGSLFKQIDEINTETKTMRPFIERINNLNDNITGIIKTPSLKGKLAENILHGTLNNLFNNVFPSWEISNVSERSHETDIQIKTDKHKILIESKYYNTRVDKKQIDKMFNDIYNTGADCAIMISYTSPIVGIKKIFEYELKNVHNKEILIIYLPNCNGNVSEGLIISSILFANSILEYKDKSSIEVNENITKGKIKKIVHDIYSKIDELSVTLTDISNIKFNIQNHRNTMNNMIDKLYSEILDAELRMQNTIIGINKYFEDEITELNLADEIRPSETDSTEIEMYLQDILQNNKTLHRYIILLVDCCKKANVNLKVDKNELIIYKNNKRIAKTKTTKKKIDLYFDIQDDCQSLTLNLKYEHIHSNKIVINICDTNVNGIITRLTNN